MERRAFLKSTLAAAAALPAGLLAGRARAADAVARPNLIVVLVDDMGWSDIGCYGSEIPTPNIDALAAGGVRFSQFYNTARCCPTRASLLTGLYPHQAGIGHMTSDRKLPGYEGRLNDRCVTIAEVLGGAGYFTAMAGKWHVGQNLGVTPWGRGFQRSLNAAAGGFYFPDSPKAQLFLNGQAVPSRGGQLPENWYSSDLWTEFGLRFIDEALGEKKPFFLYLAHNAPHFPLQAPPEDIARFRGKYMVGWDHLREERLRRQIELGLLDAKVTLSPRPGAIKAWDSLTAEEKDRFDHIMAIYAAVVSRMDQAIGTLVEGLRARGALDNTLILFMSDNGGCAESGFTGRMNGDNPGDVESSVFCGLAWAMLQDTPLRRYKHFTHEGGISSPLVAHWPAGIAARGEWRRQPGHLIDVMATCVDLAGATYPTERNGQAIQPMEGRSLAPAFRDEPIQREAIYWEHEGNAAVRQGDWKLVRRSYKGAWELYDLGADRTELNDLAAAHPDRVAAMTALWQAWAERCNVLPTLQYEFNDADQVAGKGGAAGEGDDEAPAAAAPGKKKAGKAKAGAAKVSAAKAAEQPKP